MQSKPESPRDAVLELVRESRPWRYSIRQLTRATADRTHRTKKECRKVIGLLLDREELVWERQDDVRGIDRRIELGEAHGGPRARTHVGQQEGAPASHQSPGRLLGVRSWS